MKVLTKKSKGRSIMTLCLQIAFVCAAVAIRVPSSVLSSTANLHRASFHPVMSIAVTNNSNREIIHLYLSPVDRESWGNNQLEGSLPPGQTFTISDVACAGNEIKVIAEDREGCFIYGVVSCAQASSGWTITNDVPRDCGN